MDLLEWSSIWKFIFNYHSRLHTIGRHIIQNTAKKIPDKKMNLLPAEEVCYNYFYLSLLPEGLRYCLWGICIVELCTGLHQVWAVKDAPILWSPGGHMLARQTRWCWALRHLTTVAPLYYMYTQQAPCSYIEGPLCWPCMVWPHHKMSERDIIISYTKWLPVWECIVYAHQQSMTKAQLARQIGLLAFQLWLI